MRGGLCGKLHRPPSQLLFALLILMTCVLFGTLRERFLPENNCQLCYSGAA